MRELINKLMTKNTTFGVGLAWLIYGAVDYDIRDWDIGVSLLMALCTYISADKCVQAMRELRFGEWLTHSFTAWFSVSGSYTAYWLIAGHPENMVEYQWIPSLMFYLICGVCWTSLPLLREGLVRLLETTVDFWCGPK